MSKRTVQWLIGITLTGLILRIIGLDFGLPNDSRPDEIPILQVVFHNLLRPILKDGDWRLHPRFLNYPSLYFYLQTLIFGVEYGVGRLLGWFADGRHFLMLQEMNPGNAHLMLRWFSAISGTCLIVGVALLAWQWSKKNTVALLAAGLAASNYLLVRNSHFGSVDMLMVLGVVFSLWAILRYRSLKTPKTLHLACILCGLSIGTKYPAALLLLPLWIVLLEPHLQSMDWRGFLRSAWHPTGLVILVFLLTSPWVVLDFPEFLDDFRYESHYFFDFKVPGVEPGWLFYPHFALWEGIGGTCLILSFVGLWFRLRNPVASSRWADAALLSFLLGFYLLLGFNERVMTRYALPMVPVILIYAAFGVDTLALRLSQIVQCFSAPVPHAAILSLLSLVALSPSLLRSIDFDWLLSQDDTRTLARQWILKNVPQKTPVATGPRLGLIALPWAYGQLLVETGPQFMNPPSQFKLEAYNPHFSTANSYADLDKLKKLGVRYVVTYQGLLIYGNRLWEMESLVRQARLVFFASPLKSNASPQSIGRFDPLDAFYLPYDDFSAFERPGPIIAIFDLNQPPAKP